MKNSINLDELGNKDHNASQSTSASRRPKKRTCLNFLLGFCALVVVVAATLLILDSLIRPCTSFLRPCETNSTGLTWFATKKKFTREESINYCESRKYKTANITISKEIFAESLEILNDFGNFWIIDEDFERPKSFHANKSSIMTTPRPLTTL